MKRQTIPPKRWLYVQNSHPNLWPESVTWICDHCHKQDRWQTDWNTFLLDSERSEHVKRYFVWSIFVFIFFYCNEAGRRENETPSERPKVTSLKEEVIIIRTGGAYTTLRFFFLRVWPRERSSEGTRGRSRRSFIYSGFFFFRFVFFACHWIFSADNCTRFVLTRATKATAVPRASKMVTKSPLETSARRGRASDSRVRASTIVAGFFILLLKPFTAVLRRLRVCFMVRAAHLYTSAHNSYRSVFILFIFFFLFHFYPSRA